MDTENPTSLRRLLLRAAATLLAVVVLYALSVGPAAYLEVKLRSSPMEVPSFYAALFLATQDPPLEQLRNGYVRWWVKLAGGDPDN